MSYNGVNNNMKLLTRPDYCTPIFCLVVSKAKRSNRILWCQFISLHYDILWTFFPANISVKNGTISFKRTDSYEKSEIKITDITRVETTSGLYNTVTLTVKSGVIYHLHPRDVKALEKVLKQ